MLARSLACTVWLLGLVGCDVVFQIDKLPPGPDYPGHVIADPTGDLDQDGDRNAKDLCPTMPKTEIGANVDTDGDGVGDRCDPNPTKPGDCLALFDDFDNQTEPAPQWLVQGATLSISSGSLQFERPNPDNGDEVFVYLDQPLDLDALYVWGYVQNGDDVNSNNRSAVQIFVDLEINPTTGAVFGDGCGVESSGVSTQVTHTLLNAGVETTPATAALGPQLVGVPNDFEMSWGLKPHECSGYLHGVDGEGRATVTADVPKSRVFGLRGVSVGLHLYAIAGWGHACE